MPFKLRDLIKKLKPGNNKAIRGEAKFQALFNYAGDSFFMIDPSFQITDINETACRLLNYSREELLNKKIYELMTTGDQVTFLDWARIVDKRGGSVHERKLKRKDGSLVDTEVHVRPVEGAGYISIFRDITERKKAEARILERESLLTALLNNIEGSIALYDTNKKIVLFNSRFADNYNLLTNHTPRVGDGAHDFLPEEMKKEPSALMDSALKGNKEVFEKSYLSNGKFVSFRTSFTPVINNGAVTGITSFSLDLTKNKEAEIKIRESEEKFRMSFMTGQDVFYIGTMKEGRIIDVNDSFYELFGYTREESIGKTTMELNIYAYPLDRARMIAELKTNGNLKDLELTCRKKSGELMIVSVTVNVWQMNNEPVLMAVIRDITERKRIETELIESKEQMTLFVEHSPASLAMFDNEMRYIATSRRWMTDYSLGDQDIIGKTHYEVFPEVGQEWKDIHQRCLKGAIERRDEDSFTRIDGTTDWLKWEIRPWHKASGKIGGIIMFTEVITEQKESELKFKNLIERSLIGVYLIQNWKFVYVNPKFAENLGYTQEEMLNMENSWQIHDGCYIPPDLTAWSEKMAAGIIEDYHGELEYQRKDGSIIWAKTTCYETLYKGSTALTGTFLDITKEKNAGAAIKEQAETFAAIIENASESIWLLSPDMNVLQYNKTAKEGLLISRGKEAYPGADFKEFLYKSTERVFISGFKNAVAGKKIEQESSVLNDDGQMLWLRTKMYPVYDTQKKLIGVTVLSENITDRKTVEMALEQSEDKHRALTENISDAIMLVNKHFENIYQSPSAERISGYTLEDGKGKKVFDFVHPRDREASFNIFKKAVNEPGVPVQGNFRIQHKLGHSLWIEGTVTNLFHNESIKAIIVNYRDITERKKATELFKYQFENSPDIILIINRNFTIESINHSRLNGLPPEKLVGKDSIDMLPEESRDNARKMILLCFETGKNQEIENTIRNNRWVRSRFVPMIVDGEITHIMIIATDITERKLAEERIRQSEANYRQLFDNSPAPMWVIDEKTSAIVQVNQACIKTYGYSQEEFAGMTISDISPNYKAPGSKKNINDLFFIGSQRHVKSSGELIDVVTSSIPIILNGEENILMTAIDVTEKNLYEQKLAKAAIKVQEDERYEIGGELHDNVCQLLVASLMLLGMIRRSLPEKSIGMYNEVREHISLATEEIRNLSHRLAPVFFDGETLEEALMGLLKTFNVENNYTTSLVVDKAINEQSLNRDLQLNLYRVLQEQLRNIMKHAQAKDIKIKIEMKDDILQMKITDNGIGFDPQTKRGGIGLANMNRRVQLFSGNFTINSSVGKGCEVLVDIPLVNTHQ